MSGVSEGESMSLMSKQATPTWLKRPFPLHPISPSSRDEVLNWLGIDSCSVNEKTWKNALNSPLWYHFLHFVISPEEARPFQRLLVICYPSDWWTWSSRYLDRTRGEGFAKVSFRRKVFATYGWSLWLQLAVTDIEIFSSCDLCTWISSHCLVKWFNQFQTYEVLDVWGSEA